MIYRSFELFNEVGAWFQDPVTMSTSRTPLIGISLPRFLVQDLMCCSLFQDCLC